MTRYKVRRDGDKPLEFAGEIVGEVTTRFKRDRWTELRLYQVARQSYYLDGVRSVDPDVYIAEQVGASSVPGEVNRCRAWVCYDMDHVRRCLGDGSLARQLYLQVGFEGTEVVPSRPRKDEMRKGEEDA